MTGTETLTGGAIETLREGGIGMLSEGTSPVVGILGGGGAKGLDGLLCGESIIKTARAADGFAPKCGDGGE